MCLSEKKLLKSTFSSILKNITLRNYLMLPDGSLSWFYEDYRNNLSNTFHFVGLVQHKDSLYAPYLLLEGLKEYLPLCITLFHHLLKHDQAYMVD